MKARRVMPASPAKGLAGPVVGFRMVARRVVAGDRSCANLPTCAEVYGLAAKWAGGKPWDGSKCSAGCLQRRAMEETDWQDPVNGG